MSKKATPDAKDLTLVELRGTADMHKRFALLVCWGCELPAAQFPGSRCGLQRLANLLRQVRLQRARQ